ncbi:hypothetical protein C8J57DRAFT_1391461 [Mycena rebaudengoi]|nr:hypothetical protein C8J57DRAFT_1391461 [Mycena rebaudengoi]
MHNRQYLPASRDDINDLKATFERYAQTMQSQLSDILAAPPQTQQSRSKPQMYFKRTGDPKRRTASTKQLTNAVHAHVKKLIPRGLLNVTVTRVEIVEYERLLRQQDRDGNNELSDGPEAVTIENFRIDVVGTPRSEWNKSVARVFAKDFIRKLELPNTYAMFMAVDKAFATYMKNIRAKYRLAQTSAENQARVERQDRRDSRKRGLFHRRRDIAEEIDELNEHVDMLERFGVDGMSSDESEVDDSDGELTYSITAPAWRATAATPWLRTLDAAHNLTRIGGASSVPHSLRGAWAHTRQESGRKKNGKFVRALPINAYNPAWLAQNPSKKLVLRPTEEQYDFSHRPDILEYVLASARNHPA